jgi:hypothetical protein
MSNRLFILCEKTSRWAAAVRPALRAADAQLIETRSIAGCQAALDQSPTSLVAIEVTLANLEAAVEYLKRLGPQYPRAAAIALMTAELLPAAPLVREAGAIDVATSVLDAPRLARLARRHFQLVPQPALTAQEFVNERLSWPAHAVNSTSDRQGIG